MIIFIKYNNLQEFRNLAIRHIEVGEVRRTDRENPQTDSTLNKIKNEQNNGL